MPAKKTRSKKKTGATRNQEQSSSKLSMVVVSILVASFVGFLVYLDKIPTEEQRAASNNKTSSTQKIESKKSSPPKHQFDFYTVLPDREVKVVNVEEKTVQKKSIAKSQQQNTTVKAVEPKPKIDSTFLYQLQVGAFKELSKADAMKARLAFLGVESNIQLFQNNGQKMYRVRVGPSTDSKKINQIQSQLKAKNINTFVQKISG